MRIHNNNNFEPMLTECWASVEDAGSEFSLHCLVFYVDLHLHLTQLTRTQLSEKVVL